MTGHVDSKAAIGPLRIEGLTELRTAAVELAAAAQREIILLSTDLQAQLYDQQPFLDAIRRLATSTSRARIRVLVRDVERVVKQGHRLVELASRLSSFIEIRRMAENDADGEHCFLLIDRRMLLRQQTATSRFAELDREAALSGRQLGQEFDACWELAAPDLNLRRLWL